VVSLKERLEGNINCFWADIQGAPPETARQKVEPVSHSAKKTKEKARKQHEQGKASCQKTKANPAIKIDEFPSMIPGVRGKTRSN